MIETYSQLTFQDELVQVEEQLQAAPADLQTPFRQLVEERIAQCWPPARAAVVLATGVAAEDTALLRSQRIHLGTALELLHVALGIHTQLLGSDLVRNQQGRSLLGSTILAGDYCFSRAADMAVRTQNPIVVEIFAQALKRVSEGHLRHLFQPEQERFAENVELLQAGAVAAGTLIGLGAATQSAAVELAALVADVLEPSLASSPRRVPDTLLGALQPRQQARWRELFAWLQPR